MALTKLGKNLVEARANGNAKLVSVDGFECKATFEEYKRDCYLLYCEVARVQGKRIAGEEVDVSEAFKILNRLYKQVDTQGKAHKGDVNYLCSKIFRTAKDGTVEEGKQNITRTEKLVSETGFRRSIETLFGYRLEGMIFDGEKMVKAREEDLINKKAKREAAKKAKREAERAAKQAEAEAEARAKAEAEAQAKKALQEENAKKRAKKAEAIKAAIEAEAAKKAEAVPA